MQGDDVQPPSGSNSGRQNPRPPRQSPRPRQRQQQQDGNSSGPNRSATNYSRLQGTPTESSQTSAPPADGTSVNPIAGSASAGSLDGLSQQPPSEPNMQPRRRPPPEVEDALRDLRVTRRANRPPIRRPQFEYQNATLSFGPPPPGTSENWQQTTIRPIEGRSSPATLPNGHVLTEPVQMWIQYDGPTSDSVRSSAPAQTQQASRNSQEQREPRNTQSSHRKQQSGSYPGTGNGHTANGSSRRFISPGAAHRQQPRSPGPQHAQGDTAPNRPPIPPLQHTDTETLQQRLPQMGTSRPQRPPLQNRRLRGARPGARMQKGEGMNDGRSESNGAGAEEEEDVPSCVICTGPLSVRVLA